MRSHRHSSGDPPHVNGLGGPHARNSQTHHTGGAHLASDAPSRRSRVTPYDGALSPADGSQAGFDGDATYS